MSLLRGRLINRDFARLWYGQAVSTVGDFIFETTLVLWVATVLAKDRPWAPAAVSGILFAFGLAVLTAGPVAGVLVDRWDRMRTMLRTEVVRGLLVGVLGVLSFLPAGALPVWLWLVLIYAVTFGVALCGQFFIPARLAILARIVPGEADRARAAGIEQATFAIAAIAGPPLAAPLLFGFGVQWALWLNVGSYAVSYLAIRSMSVPVGARVSAPPGTGLAGLWSEFAAGLRYFASNRVLVVLLVLTVICQLATGALNALDVFFVTDNLHTDADLYGLLSMAGGIGVIVGALSAGWLVGRLGARAVTVWSLLATGLLIIGYARQSDFAVALVLLAALLIPVGMINTAVSPMMLAAAPEEYLGRVVGVISSLSQLASMLSVVVAGWLASTVLRGFDGTVAGVHFGAIDTIFAAGGVLILLAFGYAVVALHPVPPEVPVEAA